MQRDASAKDEFNQVTIDWLDPDFELDLSGLGTFDANPDEVAAFQRDGAVLVKDTGSGCGSGGPSRDTVAWT